jgi:hypothetical protein
VRHEQQRAGIPGEIGLEPGYRLGIEMVGRLVQQEKIRLQNERSGKSDPFALPS